MVVVYSREDRLLNRRSLIWSPYHFHGLFAESFILILIVDSCKPPAIETHLAEKSSICCLVTEGINVPASGGNSAEGF